MKKFAMLLAVMAMLGSNSAFAQQGGGAKGGQGAAAGANAGASGGGMAWLVGLGALAVVGTVVGVTASSASSTPSSFGH